MRSCKDEKACAKLDAKKCNIDKFKETLRRKCPIKCRDPECVDSHECIDVTPEDCTLLDEQCPIRCSKFGMSRDMF